MYACINPVNIDVIEDLTVKVKARAKDFWLIFKMSLDWIEQSFNAPPGSV